MVPPQAFHAGKTDGFQMPSCGHSAENYYGKESLSNVLAQGSVVVVALETDGRE